MQPRKPRSTPGAPGFRREILHFADGFLLGEVADAASV